jgi:hypothetical protein
VYHLLLGVDYRDNKIVFVVWAAGSLFIAVASLYGILIGNYLSREKELNVTLARY